MSKKEKRKLEKSARLQASQESAGEKCLMRFKEHKFYNDLANPIFEANKIYELEGKDWIHRWLKRGGEIVESGKAEDASSMPEPEADPDKKAEDAQASEESPAAQDEQDDFGL